jgi:hypothetical protein
MRNYSISAGAVHTKHALRNPLKYAPVLVHMKNALLEILAGGENRYMPRIGFSHRDLLAYFGIGTVRFMSASMRRAAASDRKAAGSGEAAGKRT